MRVAGRKLPNSRTNLVLASHALLAVDLAMVGVETSSPSLRGNRRPPRRVAGRGRYYKLLIPKETLAVGAQARRRSRARTLRHDPALG